MGLLSFGADLLFGGDDDVGGQAAEEIARGNKLARGELTRRFGESSANLQGRQGVLREDFAGARGNFTPFIDAGTGALETLQQGSTISGFGDRINQIFGTDAFQGLKDERIRDLQFQQAATGTNTTGGGFQSIADISPELAFQIENQLFGRSQDLSNLGFQGAQGFGNLTLGEGELSTGLTKFEESLRANMGANVANLFSNTGQARSSGILTNEQIRQANIQSLISLGGTAASAAGGFGGAGGGGIPTGAGGSGSGGNLSFDRSTGKVLVGVGREGF